MKLFEERCSKLDISSHLIGNATMLHVTLSGNFLLRSQWCFPDIYDAVEFKKMKHLDLNVEVFSGEEPGTFHKSPRRTDTRWTRHHKQRTVSSHGACTVS